MNIFDYAIVVVYLLLLIVMGFSIKGQNTKSDYFLGGCNGQVFL
ncbi:MAG: sodium-coupled monocarboxylate transporter 8/12 [Paraglaciecola psychrophila]|jgi:sodium-coupled monocarboxylate transporter 8/12